MKDITCCFTGHRPDKLGGYDYNSNFNKKIKEKTKETVIFLIEKKGVKIFIVGGALGFDQMAFDVLYELKSIYPFIEIIVAAPFLLQYNNWIKSSVNYYFDQLKKADRKINVDTIDKYKVKGIDEEIYHVAKMQKRNEYMVDESKYMIGCFDGTKGGTKNCVDYFVKVNNKDNLYIINPTDIRNQYNFSNQYYKGILIKLLDECYDNRKAKHYSINNTFQKVWIPNSFLEHDGTLKNNINLDFVFFSEQGLNKLKLAGVK